MPARFFMIFAEHVRKLCEICTKEKTVRECSTDGENRFQLFYICLISER